MRCSSSNPPKRACRLRSPRISRRFRAPCVQQKRFSRTNVSLVPQTSQLTSDISFNTCWTPAHCDALCDILHINPDDTNSVIPQTLYNPSTGAHPAAVCALLPHPSTTPKLFEEQQHQVLARYTYQNSQNEQPSHPQQSNSSHMLQFIRGVFYLPSFGQQHLLSQGKIELFAPIIFNSPLKFAIRSPKLADVKKMIKKRDKKQLLHDGTTIELDSDPSLPSNQYYTATEHIQIQSAASNELCVDYQLQHIFYNNSNNIVVSPQEQNYRQYLEEQYDFFLSEKTHELESQMREIVLKNTLRDSITSKAFDPDQLEKERFASWRKLHSLGQELELRGGVMPSRKKYWDFSVPHVPISRSDILNWSSLTHNNNKLVSNVHNAQIHGFSGTVVPMEYLLAVALTKIAPFVAEDCTPTPPSIWQSVSAEAGTLMKKRLSEQDLEAKRDKFHVFDQARNQRRLFKKIQRRDDIRQQKKDRLNQLQIQHDERLKEGNPHGILGMLLRSNESFRLDDQLKSSPVNLEDIEVSDDEIDLRHPFGRYRHESEITLSPHEIARIDAQCAPPHFTHVFQQIRQILFKNFCPVVLPESKLGLFGRDLVIQEQRAPNHALSDVIHLDMYARVLQDEFDFRSYHSIIDSSVEQFQEMTRNIRAGVKRQSDLNLDHLVTMPDICRDRPLQIQLWFTLPPAYDPLLWGDNQSVESDPRYRPSPGIKCFEALITYDQPAQFGYLEFNEDQVQKLFGLYQGISL